jgi:hypothetical protein
MTSLGKAGRIGRSALLAACLAFALGVFLWRTPAMKAAENLRHQLPIVEHGLTLGSPWQGSIFPANLTRFPIRTLETGETYSVSVALLAADLRADERFAAVLQGPSGQVLRKELHAGDPSLYVHYRPDQTSHSSSIEVLGLRGTREVPVSVVVQPLGIAPSDQAAIEAEPNDSWRQANPLVIGRAVYGSADDVDYLDNGVQGPAGMDWFRIDFKEGVPRLVFFELEILDRDTSSNLKVYRLDDRTGDIEYYTDGRDPMETVHDRQKVRYSTFVTRVLRRGTYFVQVSANHPLYILRTKSYPVPPYDDPRQAVETAAHYLVDAGDAWHAQLPRNGDLDSRRLVQHDTAVRCASCHAAVFPISAMLKAKRNGYPILPKVQYEHLVDRLRNGPTPLYGSEAGPKGLYFLRFIGVALQVLGEQGSVLAEHNALVEGREPGSGLSRWSSYLTEAWKPRRQLADLPQAEPHSVVSLDTAFGFALRDYRVLRAQAKIGDAQAAGAADNIRRIVLSPDSRERVNNMQERVLRLQALMEMGGDEQQGEIKSDVEALFALQNPDGGWPDGIKNVTSDGTHSAEYLTGQIAAVLLQSGLSPESEPRLEKALRWLRLRQRDFGGWIQTGDTGENVRTPIRETRFAIESFAAAFPRPFTPGWQNRNGRHGEVPVPGSAGLVATLDALDSLWEIDESGHEALVRRVEEYLAPRHPALVRAMAATCLGRVGDASAVPGLVRLLSDPVKMVSRSGAVALRRLGNRGIGRAAIREALRSPQPLVRRGATRIFANQFYGMDEDLDAARAFLPLLSDPDLLTRFAASRTLTQWWYRTADLSLRKQIVEALLQRMSVPDEHPVLRESLPRQLYVLMDENLPPSPINIDRWASLLPSPLKERVREGREAVEKEALLTPILAALTSDSPTLRRSVLQSFDGSAWGRTYARYPYAASDIVNDREFQFLYQPPQQELDGVFQTLLRVEHDSTARRQAVQLAQFFQVPHRTQVPELERAFLDALVEAADGELRQVAAQVVANDLALKGSGTDKETLGLVHRALESAYTETRAAAVALAVRIPELLSDPKVRSLIRATREDPKHYGAVLAAVKTDLFTDAEVGALLARIWRAPRTDAAFRLRLLTILEGRAKVSEWASPVVRLAAADESELVRARAYRLMETDGGLRDATLVRTGLRDRSPGVRLSALRMEGTAAVDVAPALLLDPDRAVRLETLRVIEKSGLAGRQALARRVRVLCDDRDAEVRQVATALLRSSQFDPATLEPDGRVQTEHLPDFDFFKQRINPILYKTGHDELACANCHATRPVLTLVAPHPDKSPLSDDEVRANYLAAVRSIDLTDPDRSLLLRKPRSPYGKGNGDPDPESPTGLTHRGGDRWANTDGSEYVLLLQWIRGISPQ